MKAATQSRAKAAPAFADQYRSALRRYTSEASESALSQAYELGRRAMSEGKNLVEMVSVHHQALSELLATTNQERNAGILRAAVHFLAESVSPYEMAHRGFHDAIKALRRFNQTLEDEIRRIAHAVHDDAGQLLVAVHLALTELTLDLPELQRRRVAEIERLLQQVEKQLRTYSHELRPAVLDDLGWVPAIRFLASSVAKRAGIGIEVEARVVTRLPKPTETALYRIVQEALANAMKHAQAKQVSIRVFKNGHALCCSVEDDGAGFDMQTVRGDQTREGLGLIGMQERADSVGANLSIDSKRGKGTTILIRIPLEEKGHARTSRPGR